MINQNRTSEILSMGSSRRLDVLVGFPGMEVTHFPTAATHLPAHCRVEPKPVVR